MTTGMRFDEDVWNDILLLADKQKRRNVSLSQKRRIDVALSGFGTDIHSVHKQLRELESRVDGVFQVFNADKIRKKTNKLKEEDELGAFRSFTVIICRNRKLTGKIRNDIFIDVNR